MASDDQCACQQLLAHSLVFKSCLILLCRKCQENYESGINIFVLISCKWTYLRLLPRIRANWSLSAIWEGSILVTLVWCFWSCFRHLYTIDFRRATQLVSSLCRQKVTVDASFCTRNRGNFPDHLWVILKQQAVSKGVLHYSLKMNHCSMEKCSYNQLNYALISDLSSR